MRLMTKGGVWKNAEDEVLKAAVMKYGLNNWSRVASLLVRKTARQCKARWYEWLDPSVKKTPWSKQEDEKLLHMAKLFPTQWKTISASVGRTANQCLERYGELLDIASGKTVVLEDDPRKLKPGEVDPNPETRPARADAVDLDEDEREMLAEARARLANTRGKKAKRKAREKQLDEARRVAVLQKRRELKAAGISVISYRNGRRGGIDYEREIPFETKPPSTGAHPVGIEETPQVRHDVANMKLQQVEESRAKERMKRLRMQDRRALRKLHEQDLPGAMERLQETVNPFSVRKKAKLVLPEPGIRETELIELARTVQKAEEIISLDNKSSNNLSGMFKSSSSTNSLLPHHHNPNLTTTSSVVAALAAERLHASSNKSTTSALSAVSGVSLSATSSVSVSASGDVSVSTAGGVSVSIPPSKKKGKLTSRKKSVSKLTASSILDSLSPIENILKVEDESDDILDNVNGSSELDTASLNDIELFENEDETIRSIKLKDKRNKNLVRLSNIHRRVMIFEKWLPRPFDLPSDIDELKLWLKSSRSLQPKDYGVQFQLALDLIDHEVCRLYIEDELFLSADEHAKILSNKSLCNVSTKIPQAFLVHSAKHLNDVSARSMEVASQLILEEVQEKKENETSNLFDICQTTGTLITGGVSRLGVWETETDRYVIANPCDNEHLPSIISNLSEELDNVNRLIRLKRKTLNKSTRRCNILKAGYEQQANLLIQSIIKIEKYQHTLHVRQEASKWYQSIGGDDYFYSGAFLNSSKSVAITAGMSLTALPPGAS